MFAQEDPPKNSAWKIAILTAVVTATATALANEGARLIADIIRDRTIEKKPQDGQPKADK